jgi:hypothetical protein
VNARPALCDTCGALLVDGTAMYASLPDSSAIHPSDPDADGQRVVAACCAEHLAVLCDEYAHRPFVQEELWAGKIDRALQAAGGKALPPAQLATATGLTHEQIQWAIRWRNRHIRQLRKDRRG